MTFKVTEVTENLCSLESEEYKIDSGSSLVNIFVSYSDLPPPKFQRNSFWNRGSYSPQGRRSFNNRGGYHRSDCRNSYVNVLLSFHLVCCYFRIHVLIISIRNWNKETFVINKPFISHYYWQLGTGKQTPNHVINQFSPLKIEATFIT